ASAYPEGRSVRPSGPQRKGDFDGSIWPYRTVEGEEGDGRTQARDASQRLGQEGDEPEAGDRDRPVRGAQERREGAKEADLGLAASGWRPATGRFIDDDGSYRPGTGAYFPRRVSTAISRALWRSGLCSRRPRDRPPRRHRLGFIREGTQGSAHAQGRRGIRRPRLRSVG